MISWSVFPPVRSDKLQGVSSAIHEPLRYPGMAETLYAASALVSFSMPVWRSSIDGTLRKIIIKGMLGKTPSQDCTGVPVPTPT